jgi:dTMP kinase
MTSGQTGVLIAVEGIDGSGKSTLTQLLYEILASKQLPIVLTREPGGCAMGKNLKDILQSPTSSPCAKAEYLLFAADRAQHFHEVVLPALRKGNIVFSDRMADSSLAYQGYGRGLEKHFIQTVNSWSMNGRHPDLVVYVHVPVAVALERIHGRGKVSPFEEKIHFLEKVQEGFEQLYANKSNVLRIDGTQMPQVVAQKTSKQICTWLTQNKHIRPL